jgi:hypothetical protein
LKREFTGVGCLTYFRCPDLEANEPEQHLSLAELIVMPGVENGMGAVLSCRGGRPKCLETYTFCSTLWDGIPDGFAITESV